MRCGCVLTHKIIRLRSCAPAAVAIVVACATTQTRASASQTTVPISWAVDLSNGRTSNVAVTFPWIYEHSHSGIAQSPVPFRIFPQVSLLGSFGANGAVTSSSPLFALVGGICLANALGFALGLKLDGPFSHAYGMAGLSLTDIAKLAL